MSNELAKPSETGIAPFSSPASFEAAQRMARALAASSLVPVQFQGDQNIPNVLIAMELSHRIGCSPFAVIQNMDVIHGRPSLRSNFLIASVNTCGRFTPLRFQFEGNPGTPSHGCRAVATDKATKDVCTGPLITLAMAGAEGWLNKNGSKWKTMPEHMLMLRSASFWVRLYCPEIVLGMPHTSEELQETNVTPKAASLDKPTIQAKPTAQVPVEIPDPIIPVEVVQAPAAPEPDSAPQPTPVEVVVEAPVTIDDAITDDAKREIITAAMKAAGVSWAQVRDLAVANQWWDGADVIPFKKLPSDVLDFLLPRVDKIISQIKAQ